MYIGHGHVFANAQTGNIVLAAIAVASGNARIALRHLPSMLAFCLGIALSRLTGQWLKRKNHNSHTLRLICEAIALAVLAASARHLGDGAVSACIGFLVALQITAFSHIGSWSFNAGMTTGNLNSSVTAAIAAWDGTAGNRKWAQARLILLLCLSFAGGAMTGGEATFRCGDRRYSPPPPRCLPRA